ALRLERQVALARLALAQPGDDVAVDGQLEHAVIRLATVGVPFIRPLAVLLGRQAALPAQRVRAVGHAGRAPDAEEIALAGGSDSPGPLVAVGQVHEHLYLDAARVTRADGRDRVGPDEEAAVADRARRRRHVHPVKLRDEVFVL